MQTGTTHHDLCPICNCYTVDREDGYCKNAYCGEDDEANERNFMREQSKHTALTEDEMLIYGLL